MKNMKKGFTLIELLIVIAIIGILAGVILVSTNTARDKAKKSNAVSSVRSVMPYLAECVTTSLTSTNGPTSNTSGGGAVCSGSTAQWPDISATGCTYLTHTANTSMVVNCPAGQFTCNFSTGSCL